MDRASGTQDEKNENTMTHLEYSQKSKLATPCAAHHITFDGICLNCGYDPALPTITTRLSWRTKADQFYQSAGCGQTHIIKFMGTCEGCGRSVYSHGCAGSQPCGDVMEGSPDPRGAIPPAHCMNLYHASEYGLTGRDIVTCYDCSQNGDKYRGIIAAAESTGTWALPGVYAEIKAAGGGGLELKTAELYSPKHKYEKFAPSINASMDLVATH